MESDSFIYSAVPVAVTRDLRTPPSCGTTTLKTTATITYQPHEVESINMADLKLNDAHYENLATIRPIGRWLCELREATQSECLSALQAKSISTEPEVCQALSIRNTQIALHEIRDRSVEVIDCIDHQIDSLPSLELCGLNQVRLDLIEVHNEVTAIVELCRRRGCDFASPSVAQTDLDLGPHTAGIVGGKLSSAILLITTHLIKFIDLFETKQKINSAQLEATLRKLKEIFGEMVDTTLRAELKLITAGLRSRAAAGGSSSHLCIKWAILALWQLAQNDPYMCRIFIEGQVVPLLVDVLINYTNQVMERENQIKAGVLRVLTHLCVNQKETIELIASECAQGKSFMHLLTGPEHGGELVLKEVAALMVQLTTPFIDCSAASASKDGQMENFTLFSTSSLFTKFPVSDLVKCLTDAAAQTQCAETFMLLVAALANISFTHPRLLLRHQTTACLVSRATQEPDEFDTLAAKDQIITVLANLAACYPLEVVGSGGLVYLLCAFQLRPSTSSSSSLSTAYTSLSSISSHTPPPGSHHTAPGPGTAAEKSKMSPENIALATERIQQKVAVALARLGNHKSAANLISRLNGITRLVELCRDPKERNFSDTVLLACLAAARRLAETLGPEPFQRLHATGLLHSDFKKVFMAHSTHNESFV